MNSENSEYIIEQFRLEENKFDELAKLITQAFLADETAIQEGASIAFSEQTFRTMYGAPSIDRDLFVRTIWICIHLGFTTKRNQEFTMPRKILIIIIYKIINALKEKGLEYEFMIFPDEGHGYFKSKNCMKFVQ